MGVVGSFPIFYGIVVMSLVYHIVVKDSTSVYFCAVAAYDLSTEDDSFHDCSTEKRFNWAAFWGVFIRGINHLLLICMTFVSFKYAALADIN